MPEPPDSTGSDVVLEVARAAICGTDASEFAHAPKFFPIAAPHPFSGHQGPTIMGHEFTGRVAACGPEAGSLTVGDRVVCGASVSCGACEWCLRGRTNLCASYYTLGLHSHGGLAPYVRTPASLCRLVPDTCSDDAAAMAQPLAVALHALRRSGAQPGQSVAVIGAGGIGSFLIGAAAASGPARLIAVDIDDARLAAARALGASHTRPSCAHVHHELAAGAPRGECLEPARDDLGEWDLGMYGITAFDSIINAPEAAILSVGAAQPRALVDEAGGVSARPFATLTLACDHRAVYGADGAAFLARLRAPLESPEVFVL